MSEPLTSPARRSVRGDAPRLWPLLLAWTLLVFSTWAVGPFLAAGTWAWPRGWAYLGVLLPTVVLHRRYVAARTPELLRRRRRIGEGTPTWDVVWNLLFWPLMAAAPLVAGLGQRRGWPEAPWALFPLGLALLVGGFVLSARAMTANPFFEGTVRLQPDQRVVDQGPYRVLRHPGYAGLCLWALGTPFLLGAWEALAPAAVVAGWVVLRTALEDALLRRELPGYPAYAARVRWRLVPGLW